MRTFCITLDGDYESRFAQDTPGIVRNNSRTRAHFKERGVDAQFFPGFNAEKLGLRTVNPYEVDAPGSGFNMGPKPVGIWLAHRALWAACLLQPPEWSREGLDDTSYDAGTDEFLILEDDAKFAPDWRQRYFEARKVLQQNAPDWNVIFLGSCCTLGKIIRHVGGEVYDVRWPQCLQGYMVRRKALRTMIETQDSATIYGPLDCTLVFHTWERLGGVFCLLPRAIEQHDTVIPE